MNKQQLASKIWESANKMRSKIEANEYKALEEYINTFGKIEEWERGIKEIRNIENINEWEKANTELHKKCKPIFIEDVAMNEEEWNKFENWYRENYTDK